MMLLSICRRAAICVLLLDLMITCHTVFAIEEVQEVVKIEDEENAVAEKDDFEKATEFRSFLMYMFDAVDESLDATKEWRGQERFIVAALLEYLEMDTFLFGKTLTKKDGNWMYEIFKKVTSLAPPQFFHVWDEHAPSMEEINIVVTIDDEAVHLASYVDETDGKMVVDQDKLLGRAFLPFRHRGFTPTLLDTFCRVVLGPLKSVTYAIPSNEILEEIAKYQPLIEVGAGSGYWSAALKVLYDVDIEPHDAKPPHSEEEDKNVYFYDSYTDILPGDCVSVYTDPEQNTTNKTMLIVWPNNPDNIDNHEEFHTEGMPYVWDVDCLEAFLAAGGTQLIYVGEREENIHILPDGHPESGLCASRKFQTMLKERFDLVKQMDLPVWYYSDDVTFWRLKEEPTEEADKEQKSEL